MENQYLLLVSVLLGMTVGAVVYGVAAKIVSIYQEAGGIPQVLSHRLCCFQSVLRSAAESGTAVNPMKQLPGALDMLLIAGRAGMDLRNAILYLADHYIPGAVSEELQRVRRDLAFGASLSDALMEMAGRLGVTELTSLVVALTQSLETGTSISDTLSVFTSDLRRRRLLGAKEEAQTATVKIAFPMLLLIIPGIFIVLLGPVLLKLIHSVFSGV